VSLFRYEPNHFYWDVKPVVSSRYSGYVYKLKLVLRRLDGAISMVTIMVRFPVEVGDVGLPVCAQNGAGAHPASY
jgi:hypothetical protein